MKCKKHPFEPGVGVCASCLRERLLALIAANQSSSAAAIPSPPPPLPAASRSSNLAAPPLSFPRSVSPYISHRRSVDDSPFDNQNHHHHQHLFYSTPQVGPFATAAAESRKKKFSIFSTLFRFGGGDFRSAEQWQSQSQPSDPDSGFSPTLPGRSSSSSSKSSWFSSLIPGHRRKSNRCHLPSAAAAGGRKGRPRCREDHCRGMSPDPEEEEEYDFPSQSGYSTEFPSPAWRIPAPTPMRSHHRHAPAASAVSGFAVCLSPLVRASPRWRSKAAVAGDVGCSGELRATSKPNHHRHTTGGGGAVTLWPNRSRKLADFGRFS